MSSTTKKYKFAFYSVDATGHLNSAIGMAQALLNRGHDIVFIANQVLVPKIEAFGFRIVQLTCNQEEAQCSENPAKDYAKLFKENGHLSGMPSLEKLKMWSDMDETSLLYKCLVQSIDFHPQIEDALVREKPDCMIMDHVFYVPALAKLRIPFVAIMSVAPSFLYDSPDIPPSMSGYTVDDRPKWAEFHEELQKVSESYDDCQERLNAHFNFVKTDEYYRKVFYNISPFFNLYQYPRELDYTEHQSYVENLMNVEAFMRIEPGEFQIPDNIRPDREKGERLVFLSMGSMGGFDVELMTKIAESLSKMPHKFIVSKGPLGSEYSLPDNMWGEDFLPQTKILPLVDLVITHGGNNSVTEAFACGKPLLVLPLFADQYDNAQRIEEKGFGLRLDPYDYQDEQLHSAINKLLFDEHLKERLEKAKQRMEKSNSKEKACELIEARLAELDK